MKENGLASADILRRIESPENCLLREVKGGDKG